VENSDANSQHCIEPKVARIKFLKLRYMKLGSSGSDVKCVPLQCDGNHLCRTIDSH
jgi:hypothetical protein